MSTIAVTAPRGQTRRRVRVDGWRWAGRIFLVLMLLYTAVPMIWKVRKTSSPSTSLRTCSTVFGGE